jgi:DNA-binding NtrC family response regulator
MGALRENIRRAALSRGHVLLLGETGTGKELTARMIHELSPRAKGPYVAINCAALPVELFESEMFGHEKGAFTGAAQRRKGLFEEAHGGTLFLDEMGDLSLSSQARLLRTADHGLIRRVGGSGELQVDVRLVSATNKPLPDPNGKQFRDDLYHRLAGYVIHLPPLRDRRSDIPELAAHFLRLASPHSLARPNTFSPTALAALMAYDWPGNVRELRNVVERAAYLASSRVIEAVEALEQTKESFAAREAGATFRQERRRAELLPLDDVEAQHLRSVLEAHEGNVSSAAEALGIARSTLYYKLTRLKIKPRGKRWD